MKLFLIDSSKKSNYMYLRPKLYKIPKLPRHLYTFKSLRIIPNVVIIFVHDESNLEIYFTGKLLETLGNPTTLLDFCIIFTLKSMFL